MTDFRDAVFWAVRDIMRADKDVVILTNDMGAAVLDEIAAEMPERVINTGIAEQSMISMAGGLASCGKKVFVYGIIAHIVFRALEQIKLDVCVPDLPVVILGMGAGLSYGADGPSHHGVEDISVMRSLPNMTIYNPADAARLTYCVKEAYSSGTPAFIRLDKEPVDNLDLLYSREAGIGSCCPDDQDDVLIVATGNLVHAAVKAADATESFGSVGVVDLFRLAPAGIADLSSFLLPARKLLVIEENTAPYPLLSIVCETLSTHGRRDGQKIRHVGLPSRYLLGASDRKFTHKKYGMTAEAIAETVKEML